MLIKATKTYLQGIFQKIQTKQLLELSDTQKKQKLLFGALQTISCPVCPSCSLPRGRRRLWGRRDACPQETRGRSAGWNASEPFLPLLPSGHSLPSSSSSGPPRHDLCNRDRGRHHLQGGTQCCSSSWSGKVT